MPGFARLAVLGLAMVLAGPAWGTPALHAPWPCGTAYRVTNGHDTRTHTGMDEWAWDFGMPAGAEVVAPAAGVVRALRMGSSTGGCDSAYANDANFVVIDFEDGTEALLMHLEPGSSPLREGDLVEGGDLVGRVGLTGWVCGAHLHFQVQETCDSWWCQSIRAAFADVGDPAEGATVTSGNCPEPEPCDALLSGGRTVIDELSPCFERETTWWWDAGSGHDGHHYYTWANAAAEADTVGRWIFSVEVPGPYRLEAWVPGTAESSRRAAYVVRGGHGPVEAAPVDQSAAEGWVSLGIYELAAGDRRTVSLADNTGEDRSLDRRLAYDAIRLTFTPTAPDGGGDGLGEEALDRAGWDGGIVDVLPPGEDARHDPSFGFDGAEGGWACAAAPARAPRQSLLAALLALVVVALRRAA